MKEITLEQVQDKLKSAEIRERQKYNYYCDRTVGLWDWSEEDEEKYQKEWDDIIEELHALKDLENAMKKAEKYL